MVRDTYLRTSRYQRERERKYEKLECQFVLTKLIVCIDFVAYTKVVADNLGTGHRALSDISVFVGPFCYVRLSGFRRS